MRPDYGVRGPLVRYEHALGAGLPVTRVAPTADARGVLSLGADGAVRLWPVRDLLLDTPLAPAKSAARRGSEACGRGLEYCAVFRLLTPKRLWLAIGAWTMLGPERKRLRQDG